MSFRIDIHADDYAYSLHTSKDMLECMKEGKLDSFSIICNTAYFEECMDLLYREIPDLPFLPMMSIHLNIAEGDCDSDLLPAGWGKLLLSSYSFGKGKMKEELRKELKRQIEKAKPAIEKCLAIAKENGIPCKQKALRLDSHVHTHLIPVVWQSLVEVIEEEGYEVEYIRNPKEPLLPFLKDFSLIGTYGLTNLLKNRILMFYSGKVDRYMDLHKTDKMYMWGLTMSGHMDSQRIEKIYPEMEKKAKSDDRVLELLFHPGQALKEEYSREMNPDYFRDFNSSDNRTTEKDSVMSIDKLIG